MSRALMHPASQEILGNEQVMHELRQILEWSLRDLRQRESLDFDLNRVTRFEIPDTLSNRLDQITRGFAETIADHLAADLKAKAEQAAREKLTRNASTIVGAILA